MKTMYRCKHNFYGNLIDEIEVEKETEKMVMLVNGMRESKDSTYSSVHDTWDDAHIKLMGIAERKVNNARTRLEVCEADLKRILEMDS